MKKKQFLPVHSRPGKRKGIFRAFAVTVCISLLTAALLTAPLQPFHTYVLADTASDISDAKDKKQEAQDQISAAQEQIDALAGQTDQLNSDLTYLNQLSAEQKAQYETIAAELEAALTAKQDALNMYLASQTALDTKKTEYSQRMSVMFEYQNKSTLEILLESDGIAGFFTNLELISLIGDADRQALDDLQAAIDDAALKSTYAQQEAADMQAVADEKQAELDELEARIGNTTAALAESQTKLSEWQQKEDALESVSDELDSQIAALQKKQSEAAAAAAAAAQKKQSTASAGTASAGTASAAPSTGSMTWPVPGAYVSSPYGMRYHPTTGAYTMHTGVDLAADYGTPILAAAGGTVIIASAPVAGQNTGGSGYGNYIVIDHGNGDSTLYGHCRNLYVSVGDTVSAGEKIAEVGSTGTSTGPHCHFEVRINGQRVDPLDYIS